MLYTMLHSKNQLDQLEGRDVNSGGHNKGKD